MLKCSKTYRSLPEEERCSSLSPHVFTFSVYEHKGEVHLLLRSIIIVIIGLANGGKLSLAVIPSLCFFVFFFKLTLFLFFVFISTGRKPTTVPISSNGQLLPRVQE